jgi:ferredoxin
MDIDVMEYVARAIRGDVAGVAQLSFDCVMCGLCTARCPAEEVQYQFAILCRRLYGKYIAPRAQHLSARIGDVEKGKYEKSLRDLMAVSRDELKRLYSDREIEPEMAEEDWKPKTSKYL